MRYEYNDGMRFKSVCFKGRGSKMILKWQREANRSLFHLHVLGGRKETAMATQEGYQGE